MEDEEYINEDNDPTTVEKVDDSLPIVNDDEKVEFDEVISGVKTSKKNMKKYDEIMNDKVLNMLMDDISK